MPRTSSFTDVHPHSNIDMLPRSLQQALEEVERQTGFTGMIIVAGPVPNNGGGMRTHM